MALKEQLREKAIELGFEDVGFTNVRPFDLYIEEINSRPEKMYRWVQTDQLNINRGASFAEKYPCAQV